MRLPRNPNLPDAGNPRYEQELKARIDKLFRDFAQQVNQLTEGRAYAVHNATDSEPTDSNYAQGDFVRNSAPTEQGSAGGKYVVTGWLNVSATDTPEWKECRCLTGN